MNTALGELARLLLKCLVMAAKLAILLCSRLWKVQPFFDGSAYSPETLISRISADHKSVSKSGSSSPKEFKESFLVDFDATDVVFFRKVILAKDIVEIVHAYGYGMHEHVVKTTDGYLLSLHRILPKSPLSQADIAGRPVVFMQHGLLTNSESFVTGDTASRCLPFRLVDLGYDVWLGNNRGNKYSRKHVSLSCDQREFWNFSLDEFALFDIPDSVHYILKQTGLRSLSLVGFSQGSAQSMAALSLNPGLNSQVNLFVGLSPAMIPQGLRDPGVSQILQSHPSFWYTMFGNKAILPSVIFWQRLFGPELYRRVVDKSLQLLFGWKTTNITPSQKSVAYPHMFSMSSVKSVVHWFQIIGQNRFQMYDEKASAGSLLLSLTSDYAKNTRVTPFPTQTIKTPMLLIYGQSDILMDMDKTLSQLTCDVETIGIPGYEHMDTLWANDVETAVFDKVASKLRQYRWPVDVAKS